VASFQSAYGIRLGTELGGMSWREFSYLINAMPGDTPLGRVISIRAETDPAVIKDFTPGEKRIRSEYLTKAAKQMPQAKVDRALEGFKQAFIGLAK
jgi:hypothetical protein